MKNIFGLVIFVCGSFIMSWGIQLIDDKIIIEKIIEGLEEQGVYIKL